MSFQICMNLFLLCNIISEIQEILVHTVEIVHTVKFYKKNILVLNRRKSFGIKWEWGNYDNLSLYPPTERDLWVCTCVSGCVFLASMLLTFCSMDRKKSMLCSLSILKDKGVQRTCISRGENQKGVSDIFGEMEIYTSNESS